MTARYHKGDENGTSNAKFGKLALSQEARDAGFFDVWLKDIEPITQRESDSSVLLSSKPACCIGRRVHKGDENAKTTYYVRQIIAAKEGEVITEYHTCDCELYDFKEVTNKKESKAGWVEYAGKIIVGRKHHGDENGTTITTFASVRIVDGDKTYPLDVVDIEELKGRKESDSDFHIDDVNQFKVWEKAVDGLSFASHTWVESIDPEDQFRCNGDCEKRKLIKAVYVDKYAYPVMSKLRGNDGSHSVGIYYGFTGMCHQMANRFIYPISHETIGFSSGVKCYITTCLLYGKLGRFYHLWYKNNYVPTDKKVKRLSSVEVDAPAIMPDIEEDTKMLNAYAKVIFEVFGIEADLAKVNEAQGRWIADLHNIMSKYGIIDEKDTYKEHTSMTKSIALDMGAELTAAINAFFTALKSAVGNENFKLLNDGSDEIPNILDMNLFVESYCN